MILPNDERCREIVAALLDEPSLTAWEQDFVVSNEEREFFSDGQKEVCAKLREKYDV